MARERWRALLGSRGSLGTCFLSHSMRTVLGRAPLLLQQNEVCCSVMRTKSAWSNIISFYLFGFPRDIKVFIWVDVMQRGTGITFENFCCKFFKSGLKKKTEIASHVCHNFMLSHVMFISCSFISHHVMNIPNGAIAF